LPIRALNHTAAPRVARPHVGFDGPVYLQPMDPKNPPQYDMNVRAVKFNCMKFGFTLQLQIHKMIGVE
jgi:organic radical activating enzyme